ncbi:MAG: chromate transporter [Clostridia bacterium]|nr:chromate transporter [Clostridia bacterium]
MKNNTAKQTKLNQIFTVFLSFFKIGAFTFGGGYAMIPLIQKEICEKHNWITDEDILDIIAIAESTPGPIAINAATFVGFKICGFWGALFATLGVVLPSFTIIILIAYILREFQHIKVVQYAFNGIRAGVLALIVRALYSMYKQCPKNLISYVIAALSFIAAAIIGINVLFVILGCAIIGLTVSLINSGRFKQ